MKKSLIALAALAVVSAASAQTSSLTISGYIDRGYTNLNSNLNTADTKTVGSAAGTTAVFIKGAEDVGAGNTVGFSIESDWKEFGGSTQTASIAPAQSAGFANGETFVSLANATMGTLKLGAPNSFTLGNVTGVASPAFSTGVGSAYSTKWSIANGISTGADTYAGTAQYTAPSATGVGSRSIRFANTIQYSSPVFSGFTAAFAYAAKNNNVTAVPGNGNTVGMTEYALRYTNGPVDAMYTNVKFSVGSNGASQYTLTLLNTPSPILGTSKPLTGNLTSTQGMLGATYTVLPTLKLHAGLGQFSSSDNTAKGSSTQFGVTYIIGAVDLMAQMASMNDKATTNFDRKMFGLGANYNLSKTARIYARYDELKTNSGVAAANTGDVVKRTAIGVSKTF